MTHSATCPLSPTEHQAVERLVRRAGDALLEFWPSTERFESAQQTDLGVELKDDGSPVSRADYASNEILVSGLRQLLPNDGILSEEIPRILSEEIPRVLADEGARAATAPSAERLWIIDPLDGTRSFLNGNDDFSVLVALCCGPLPVCGWLNFPARRVLATACRGTGARVDGELVAVSKAPQLRPERVYVRNVAIAEPTLVYPEWLDSGCAMLMLASGEFDAVIIRLLTHREWDLAAPTVLIEEAGGRVSDEHGNPISYNTGGMPCRYFIASNGAVHDQVLALIPKEDL